MIPEIGLLVDEFAGEKWNTVTQEAYMARLVEQDYYIGSKNPKDPALSARDRINRAPKALGFVNLKPTIELTAAGEELLAESFAQEALLRQLLKFQLPSPYHVLSKGSDQDFFVKPYLEIIRLVRRMGTVSFDELVLFGMQLTNYEKFEDIVGKIEEFRIGKARNEGHYRQFLADCFEREIKELYAKEIASGKIGTRESAERSLKRFISAKRSNMRDYADACFRYLRATEIITVSQRGHSLSIAPDRINDADYILETVSPKPVFVEDEEGYKRYLFDPSAPRLLADNRDELIARIKVVNPTINVDGKSLSELKSLELGLRTNRKADALERQIIRIKEFREYDDIQETFDGILSKAYVDDPLMFEWNAWRAMVMLDGGIIEPNFKLDDDGLPLATAAGNVADIQCDYGSFRATVEVTLQSGQKQYDNEGEPVARHLGKLKELTGQEVYCLFVAPKIHDATIAHFYMLHRVNVAHYGGRSVIVPLELAVFRKMVESTRNSEFIPKPSNVEALFKKSVEVANSAADEHEWFQAMKDYALNWPVL